MLPIVTCAVLSTLYASPRKDPGLRDVFADKGGVSFASRLTAVGDQE